MREFVLDASFALHWCFEEEAIAETEAILTLLQNQEGVAWVPGIWPYEVLNGIGKGISRGRLERSKGLSLWQEIQELPLRLVEIRIDQVLLELALTHNLAIYDASYLSLAMARALPIATADKKLTDAAKAAGLALLTA